MYVYIHTRTPRALKRALRSILSKFLTYPISSCVRSLLIASTMMMMTMTGMETPIQKRPKRHQTTAKDSNREQTKTNDSKRQQTKANDSKR